MDRSKLKNAVKEKIAAMSKEMIALALDIWEHPELAWHEEHSVKVLREFLAKHGVESADNYCGYPTSFRGDFGADGGPVFAIAAEYDALPPGHACGHNLIAAAGVGAMCAAAAAMKELGLPGKLVILGTPAEESGSGKVQMLKKDCLRGIDAVMMVHPSAVTIPDRGSLAIKRYDVTFHGVSSHAAASPELGVNALDAVVTLFNGINAYRQQLPEFCRIHGIITNGGVRPNIIPDEASCRFYLRSADEAWMDKIDKRFCEIVKGAALIAGTTYTLSDYSLGCQSRKPNRYLNESYVEMMTELGETIPPKPIAGRGSSDFGNFSQAIPGAHPYFRISEKAIGGHSEDFMEAARSPLGLENMLKAATAMAYTACRFLAEPEFRDAVKKDFEA